MTLCLYSYIAETLFQLFYNRYQEKRGGHQHRFAILSLIVQSMTIKYNPIV